MPDAKNVIIGIDLGTTNSLVGFADHAGPHLIAGPAGEDDVMLPSVIAVDDDGRRISVGHDARAHAVERPHHTVYSIKRLMGRGFADLTGDLSHLAYRVERGGGAHAGRDVAAVHLAGRVYTPPELSAMVLAELGARAKRHFGHDVKRAVITVPARFDDAQRQATRDAGQIAGLEVVRIVNEPTAAALAYGLDHTERATVAVYDLGGGTFDVSILRLEDGLFEVLATNGDTHLGGDDFDHALIDLFNREISEQFGVDIRSATIKQQMRTLSEMIKKRLSDREAADVQIAIGADAVYRRTIGRGEFETMIKPLVDRTITACSQAMRTAKLTPDKIDTVVMVGGSTRVPFVRRRVGEVFACTPHTALNPEHVVALGAALQASILAGIERDLLLLDVTPLSLGIETLGGAMGKLIGANVRIPCQATETFTTFQDGQTNVRINVLQGERELAKDCRSLGVFELTDVPPMPSGIPKIDVTFLIDQSGMLHVSAREQRSGQAAGVQIIPSHGLTRDEVRRMEAEALEHAREDMTAHHLIDVRTTVEFDLNKAEQMIERFGHLTGVTERERLSAAVTDLRAFARQCDDPVAINERREAFNRSTIALAEKAMTATLQVEGDETADRGKPQRTASRVSTSDSGGQDRSFTAEHAEKPEIRTT